jgi:uncharacterized protein (TIGR02453 family)
MAFFTPDAIEFFRELELNNDRDWFAVNKKRYEASVKKPLERFVERLIERYREYEPDIAIAPKDSLFRIHRDVRFSKDKAPYKTHAGAVVSKHGRKGVDAGIYFHFDARRVGVASGYYDVEPDLLLRLRRLIVEKPDEFARLLEDPVFQKTYGGIEGEKNKVLPAEFKEAAQAQPYLFHKQFYYWREAEAETLLRDDLDSWVLATYAAARPMNAFLAQAL